MRRLGAGQRGSTGRVAAAEFSVLRAGSDDKLATRGHAGIKDKSGQTVPPSQGGAAGAIGNATARFLRSSQNWIRLFTSFQLIG